MLIVNPGYSILLPGLIVSSIPHILQIMNYSISYVLAFIIRIILLE